MSHCVIEVLTESIRERRKYAKQCRDLVAAGSANAAMFERRADALDKDADELTAAREHCLQEGIVTTRGLQEVYLGFSMGSAKFNRMISRLDAIAGMESPWSHVYWRFTWERGPDLIYESLAKHGVCITPRERLLRAYDQKKITAIKEIRLALDATTMNRLWNACVNLHGKAYDKRHIAGLYVWIRAHSRKMDKRPWWLRKALNDRYICSEFTAETAHQAGINLLGDWSTMETTTPHSQWIVMREADHA